MELRENDGVGVVDVAVAGEVSGAYWHLRCGSECVVESVRQWHLVHRKGGAGFLKAHRGIGPHVALMEAATVARGSGEVAGQREDGGGVAASTGSGGGVIHGHRRSFRRRRAGGRG
jgi:hypothetical protein